MKRTIRLAATALAALACAGCTSFDVIRSATFVSEDGEYLHVDYAHQHDAHTCNPAKGRFADLAGNLKVRVTTPDGDTFVANQTMSEIGVFYESANGKWRYLEQGTGCMLAKKISDERGFALRFQGVMCAHAREKEKDGDKGVWRKVRK